MSQAKDSVRFTGTFIRASDAERGCVLFRTSRSMPDFARSSFYTTLQCERAHVPTGCSACPTKFANYNAVLPNVRLQRRARHITKSQRDFASKPKVVRNELPWVNIATRAQLQRSCGLYEHASNNLTGNAKSANNLRHNPNYRSNIFRLPSRLLLCQTMQAAKSQHKIHRMNAEHQPVLE